MKIVINETERARECAKRINETANSFKSIVATMRYLQNQINENWQGGSKDISDINLGLNESIKYYTEKIIPALEKLSNGIKLYADATDELAEDGIDCSPSVWVQTPEYKSQIKN